MVPDETMIASPIHTPSPPMVKRRIPVMMIAMIVGIDPKKRPEIASSTERASKNMPGINVQGDNINKIPITPMTIPVMIFKKLLLNASFFNQKFSYSIVKASSTAAL